MISLSPCVIVLLSNVAKGNEFCLPVNVALFSRNLQSVLLHPVIKHKVLKKLPQNVCINKANSLFNQTNCQELSVYRHRSAHTVRYACVAHTSVAVCACNEDSFRRILCPTRKTVKGFTSQNLADLFLNFSLLVSHEAHSHQAREETAQCFVSIHMDW